MFKPTGKRRRTGCTKILSIKVGLSRDYIFRSRDAKFMRKSVARAQNLMVAEFMKRADNSFELPCKKDQVRGLGKFGLVDTLANLHAKFQMEKPDVVVSLARFCKSRPKNIKLIEWTARKTCLCQRHANIALLCKAAKNLPLSRQAMCQMDGMAITAKLQQIPREHVDFMKWERTDVKFDGRVIKKVKLVKKALDRKGFTDEILGQMVEFRSHCHRVGLIYGQLQRLKSVLKRKCEVMILLDFSKKWCCKYQDEVSACYYNNKQITIHPMVVYHRDIDNNVLHDSYVGITAETTHTAPTIMAFINSVMTYVKAALPGLEIVHFVSDSPSSQYRNRTICAIVANLYDTLSAKATWTWLEAGHVKKAADNIVKSGSSIQDAQS